MSFIHRRTRPIVLALLQRGRVRQECEVCCIYQANGAQRTRSSAAERPNNLGNCPRMRGVGTRSAGHIAMCAGSAGGVAKMRMALEQRLRKAVVVQVSRAGTRFARVARGGAWGHSSFPSKRGQA